MKFSERKNTENELNLKKVGCCKMEDSPKRAVHNSKCNLLNWTHGFFKVSKYKGKIKFEKKNWNSPSNGTAEIQTF